MIHTNKALAALKNIMTNKNLSIAAVNPNLNSPTIAANVAKETTNLSYVLSLMLSLLI